jgi:hypothetical protein
METENHTLLGDDERKKESLVSTESQADTPKPRVLIMPPPDVGSMAPVFMPKPSGLQFGAPSAMMM